MAIYPDWYNPNDVQPRKSRLDKALDSLATVALGWMSIADEKLLKEEQNAKETRNFKRSIRASEINRLSRVNPEIDPLVYGDPWTNPSDYTKYNTAIRNSVNMKQFGGDFVPQNGVLSLEAERDVFNYGSTNLNLEHSPERLAMNDVLNFDAWLLGDKGTGKDIARRHNWDGLLNDKSKTTDEQWVLDGDEFRDLQTKGLLPLTIKEEGGLYTLDTNERDQVLENYKYWRQGFIDTHEVPKTEDVSQQIQDENLATMTSLSQQRLNPLLAPKFEATKMWNKVMVDPDLFFITKEKDTGYVTYNTDEEPGMESDDFKTKHPETWKFVSMYPKIEDAYKEWLSNSDLRDKVYQTSTLLGSHIDGVFEDHVQLKSMLAQMGIDVTLTNHLVAENVQAKGRDDILDMLHSSAFGNGVLFDEEKFDKLSVNEQNKMNDRLRAYENQLKLDNRDAVSFLELYGLGQKGVDGGYALLNLIDEITQPTNERRGLK